MLGSKKDATLRENIALSKKKLELQYARSEKKSTVGIMKMTVAANFLSLACITVAKNRTKSPAIRLANSRKPKRRLKPSHLVEPGKML